MYTPDPWNIVNEFPQLSSDVTGNKIVYDGWGEIAMGGPMSAGAHIELANGKLITVDASIGFPAVWNEAGTQVAFPVWDKHRRQNIGVICTESKSYTIYAKLFRVLHLETFNYGIIKGIDSPIHKTEKVQFDITKEAILRKGEC